MLRKLFVISEFSTHGAPLFLKREGGSQQHVIEIDTVSYTFGFGMDGVSVWTDQADAETFLMMNEQHFAQIEGGAFQIQPIYKWYATNPDDEPTGAEHVDTGKAGKKKR